MMIDEINQHLSIYDYDIRKTNDARFMDQKVTPDVLCIISDCVLNYVADRDIEFSKDDIWEDKYFNTNVKAIFNKPDADNKTAKREYDKFTSQPLRMLAYAGILKREMKNNKNIYKIANKHILEFIAIKERNAYLFLYLYLVKVLKDSGLLSRFEEYKVLCESNLVTDSDFMELKEKFQRFILGNTGIKGTTEINRIYPKILNVYACENNIQGTIKGKLSNRQIYYTDLMYNRPNWRDLNKNKGVSRTEALIEINDANSVRSEAYSNYMVQKAIQVIKKLYNQSEIKDQWANGEATQVHHIFPKSKFPQLSHYLENLIKLTPTQHYTKAHPNNKTDYINLDYQLVCLLAKSDSIETSLAKGEFIYRKESFIYVINTGLSQNLNYNLELCEIKKQLVRMYNLN